MSRDTEIGNNDARFWRVQYEQMSKEREHYFLRYADAAHEVERLRAELAALREPVKQAAGERTWREFVKEVQKRVRAANTRYHYSVDELLQAMGKHTAEVAAEWELEGESDARP